jgi:hypothetical protein
VKFFDSSEKKKNIEISNFMKIRQVGNQFLRVYGRTNGQTERDRQTDRQTDMKKLRVALRNFADTPKDENSSTFPVSSLGNNK